MFTFPQGKDKEESREKSEKKSSEKVGDLIFIICDGSAPRD